MVTTVEHAYRRVRVAAGEGAEELFLSIYFDRSTRIMYRTESYI